jgi:hypothetical protein
MFTDRYFPSAAKQTFVSSPKDELKAIEGTYETTRRADSNRGSLLAVFGESAVTVDKDGVLHTGERKDLRGHPMKFKPIAKDLWQEIDGQDRVFAIRGADGRVERLAVDFPGVQLERVRWWKTAKFVGTAAGFSLGVLVLVIVAPLWRMLRRIFQRHRQGPQEQPGTMWLPFMTKVAAVVWIVPLAATLWLIISAADDLMPPTTAWDKWFVLMNLVVGLALVLSLFPVISAKRVWGMDQIRWITKIKFTLVALSFLVLAWISLYFHLIGTLRI